MSSMAAAMVALDSLTLNIVQEIHVRASLEVTFETLLEQLGPRNEVSNGTAMPMKLEAWPGGRWFRDWATGTDTSGDMCRRSSGRRCWSLRGRCLCRIRWRRMCSTG